MALLLAMIAGASHAVVWPGAAPCNATLQACIDGVANGAVVEIASDGPISTAILLSRSVTVRPAAGFAPVFSVFPSIVGSFAQSTPTVVTIEDLALRDGAIRLQQIGSGAATFNVRRVRILNTATAATDGIRIESFAAGALTVDVRDNRFERRGAAAAPITVRAGAGSGPVSGVIAFNHVRMPDNSSSAWGILVSRVLDRDIAVDVFANEVRGDFTLGQIGVVGDSNAGSTLGRTRVDVASNVLVGRIGLGTGIAVRGDDAEVNARVYNNTIVNRGTAIDFSRWPNASTPDLRGVIANNLIAHNSFRGVSLTDAAAVTNDHNLIFDSASNTGFTPGTGTLTVDPLLLSRKHPWLRAGSPAIGAGNTAFGVLAPAFADLPQLDGDGMRRLSGTDIDIGAREFGDLSVLHRATAPSVSSNFTRISHPDIDGDAAARLFVTPNYNAGVTPGGPSFSQPLGVYYSASTWRIFDQEVTAFPVDSKFNVFRPQSGPGVFGHVTSASSVNAFTSVIDDSALNDQPGKFVLLTQNWTSGGLGTYNPQPVGVLYFSFGGPGSWMVANTAPAPADMPEGVGFNLYVQDPSPNAFRVVATAANRIGQTLELDHPLLNDTPCAQVHVTRIYNGVPIAEHFDVRYMQASQRWTILHQNVGSMALGSEFFVLVNPRQVYECAGSLFADGFEEPSI